MKFGRVTVVPTPVQGQLEGGKTIINNILLLQEEVINNILRCCLKIKCVCDQATCYNTKQCDVWVYVALARYEKIR